MAQYPLTWILVADSARARIFEWSEPSAPLTEITDLTNPQGRLKEQALSSDRPGVASSAHGSNSGHPMQASHSGHDKSESVFAGQIDATLVAALDAGRYKQLMLFAAPHFLGSLRSQLTPRVAKTVVESNPLDLTREDVSAIKSRLTALKAVL